MSGAQARWQWPSWTESRSRLKAAVDSSWSFARRSSRRRRSGPRVALISGIAAVLVVGGIGVIPRAFAADPCNPLVNTIACENSLVGNPWQEWDIAGAGDATIQGFATSVSVNSGSPISFKIKTNAAAYDIDIYRLGYYNGDGARKVKSLTPSVALPQIQPACVTDPATEIYDCGGWSVSASWSVPATAVSGVYIAKLTRKDTGGASHIPFVVRNDASTSALLVKTSDATWQAYNTYGGSDFYQGSVNGRSYKVSYNRPYSTRHDNYGRDFLFSNEYPMIRFLESNGYDISYTTDLDADIRGNLIKNHKAFVSVGHDEYWSGPERANVEAARDAGVSLAFFSGNEVYWKTRWEPSQDGSNTPNRTLVSYKETWAYAKIDPSPEWTGTYRDPRFSPPSNGGRPENALTGTLYMANHDDLALTVSAAEGKYRLWRSTAAANLSSGATTLAPHTVGYESDEDIDNGFRPAGLVRLSTTTGQIPEYLQDFGNTVAPGTTTHHVTLYRAVSGALVFSAGTVQWAWGLSDQHDGIESPADPTMQQATVNLLADMGVQPGTLISGLQAVSASTDGQAPTTTITAPAVGTSITNGNSVTLTGTAVDTGGGKVAGVEVSTDGGTTWHPATGTTAWSYTFIASGSTTLSVAVRATDDSANMGLTPSTRTFALTGNHSLFGMAVPATTSANDSSALELGLKFTPQTGGFIKGIRFYKGTGNTGTHTGSLWSSSGTRLATGTFTGESATGWQTLTFATAVPVNAATTYVASYYAPNGHYADDPRAFSYRDWVATPLAANRSTQASGNGLFRYGGGFPAESASDANYYVDVTFISADDAAPSVVSVNPLSDSTGVPVSIQPAAFFSKSLNPAQNTFVLKDPSNATIAGSIAYDDAVKSVTFTPAAPLLAAQLYTATVTVKDTLGNPGSATWQFTTDLDASVTKLFATNAVPGTAAANDSNAVELGVKFVPAQNGTIVGVRYYQGPGNTGSHTGSLWSSSGTLLAQLAFPNTAGSGWQTARFDTPVAVTAGTTYVASYYAPTGHYSADAGFFNSTYTNGPLSAPASTNGVFRYGASGFPTDAWQATNYWVDPLFVPGGTVPTPTPTPTPSPTPSSAGSLFSLSDTPSSPNWNDTSAIEVGVKFTSDVAGSVSAVRFYKGASNTGTHTGSLWSSTGTLLATGTFAGETASGWQTLTFTTPVAITAGTTYVASYHTNVGYYSVNLNAFSAGLNRPPLHVPATGAAYRYGAGFPDSAGNHNYWVDIVFTAS